MGKRGGGRLENPHRIHAEQNSQNASAQAETVSQRQLAMDADQNYGEYQQDADKGGDGGEIAHGRMFNKPMVPSVSRTKYTMGAADFNLSYDTGLPFDNILILKLMPPASARLPGSGAPIIDPSGRLA
jgi:hypothetical protein